MSKSHQEHQGKIRFGTYFIYGLIGIACIFGIWWFATSEGRQGPYTKGIVHWHADVTMNVCGKTVDLPRIPQGAHHLGTPLLHTHDDNKIHIEGQVFYKKQITLGAFMNAVGIPFDSNTLFTYKNGDKCSNGKPGQVSLFVNTVKSNELRDLVISDGQDIRLIFN